MNFVKIKDIFFSSDSRTRLIKKNILSSFGLKFITILLDFLLVPLALSYLTQTSYGIWLTVSSMINWFNLFDLGISHGYRNKLSIALANNDLSLAKTLTSTAYVVIGVISGLLLVFSFIIIPLIDWNWVLNTDSITNKQLVLLIKIVLICFSFNLVLKILTSIFLAKQMPLYTKLVEVISKTFIFIGILIISSFLKENLVFYVSIVSIVPLTILFIFNIFFFNRSYKSLKPSFKNFEKRRIKDIMGLGIKFFLIQLGATMLFMTDNIIIINLFSPAEVTPYEVSKKYFSILLIVSAIIIQPFWSAITEAYEKNDIPWIKKSIKSLNKIWFIYVLCSIIMVLVFYPFLKLWTGDKILVPISLVIQWSLFIILHTRNNIYTFFLNGIGKIRIQLITGLISFGMNIPLSIFFAKHLGLGSSGVLLATNFSILFYVIIREIQYHKIINNRAYGIWNK
jgi:O-antigen/teichoic acid export membrane protein